MCEMLRTLSLSPLINLEIVAHFSRDPLARAHGKKGTAKVNPFGEEVIAKRC
jgi:hypothetical protein